MIHRQLGTTGIEVSVIGLGAEHLDNKPYAVADEVIGAALDAGITIMDLFMPGEAVRTHIGKVLKGRRQQLCIQGAIGSVDLREQYDVSRDLPTCKRYFEELLRCLNTEYIDLGMLFFMDSHADIDAAIDNGIVDYARQLKQNGTIRAIGASAHNPATAKRLVEEGLIDMLMFSINPAFDMMPGDADLVSMLGDEFTSLPTRMNPERADLYRLCQSRGVGVTVMKSLGAGKLLSAEHTPFAEALTPAQCVHYALTRPAVSSVLVGCKSGAEVQAAVSYLSTPDAEKDYSRAISAFSAQGKTGFKGACVYCNHCLPCPVAIDIAAVHKYLDIASLDEFNIPPSVRQHYLALDAHASSCVACGHCEERCPFAVQVVANMRRAVELFGK